MATAPFVDRRRGRTPDVAAHGLALVDELIGDAEPDVQKALAWALRSLTIVDADAVLAFVERQADLAAATDDGYRAWVLRDVLVKLPSEPAAAIRTRLDGVRRRAGRPSTSRAAATAARFNGDVRLGPDAHRDRFPDPAAPSAGDPSQ